jgi:pimeloyl-ACP methyl ester carboxylesterase
MSNTITPTVFYRTLNVEGLEIFYREAGPRDAPTVLLLHGFPSLVKGDFRCHFEKT